MRVEDQTKVVVGVPFAKTVRLDALERIEELIEAVTEGTVEIAPGALLPLQLAESLTW